MRIGFWICFFLLTHSCSTRTNNQDEWDKQNLRDIEVDDPKVARAFKAAQDSLNLFIDYFKEFYGQEDYSFFIKKRFGDNGEFEHMWSRPFVLTKTGFQCILDNEPNGLSNYRLGDSVLVDFEDIEDFIVVAADTTVVGNYLQSELLE